MNKSVFSQQLFFYFDVDMISNIAEINQNNELSCLRFVYRSKSGNVGFEVDSIAGRLWMNFIQNAMAWCPAKNRLCSFSEFPNQNPYLFLMSLFVLADYPTTTTFITYHYPIQSIGNMNLLHSELSKISIQKREEIYSCLPNLLSLFEHIIIWNITDMEPLVFTKNSESFVNWVKYLCICNSIQFVEAEAVSQLPIW